MVQLVMLDQAAFARLQKLGGAELVREIIDLFLVDGQERVKCAVTSQAQGDCNGLERAVHSLKSSAANLGAWDLYKLASRIEELAAAKSTNCTAPLVAELPGLFDQVKQQLAEIRRGM